MASCSDLLAELSNYLDDQVDPELRRDLEHHLRECRTCRVLLDSTRKTLTIVTESRSFELPVAERIARGVLEKLANGSCDDPSDPSRS